MKKTLLIVWLLAAACLESVAGPPGGYVSYRHLGDSVYQISLKFYRNCISYAPTSEEQYKITIENSGYGVTERVPLSSIENISQSCSKYKSCYPAGTYQASNGIELITYLDTIDFKNSTYSVFFKSGSPILFQYFGFSRPGNITNLTSSASLYLYAKLDPSLGNISSPELLAPPLIRGFIGQDLIHTYSVTNHADSISYAIVPPRYNYTSVISYSTQTPIEGFYQLKWKYPDSEINVRPVIGFYFDKKTGVLAVNPATSSKSVVVVEISQWKKDSTGTMRLVSRFINENVVEVEYPSTYSPQLSGTFEHHVCEGETLNFNIAAYNPSFTGATTIDSLSDFKIYNIIAGASYKQLNGYTNNRDSLQFTWTPAEGMAKTDAYFFTPYVQNNACALYLYAARPVLIYVHPKARSVTSVEALGCNDFVVKSTPESTFSYPAKYQWEVLNSAGMVANSDVAYFVKSKLNTSTQQSDTVYIRKAGTYFVRHTISNVYGCKTVYMDTITTNTSISELFVNKIGVVCLNDSLKLAQDLYSSGGFKLFQWNNGVENAEYFVKYAETQKQFALKATPNSGCFYFDIKTTYRAEPPKIMVEAMAMFCKPIADTISVEVMNKYTFDPEIIKWNNVVGGNDLVIHQSGLYRVSVENTCGLVLDSTLVVEADKPQLHVANNQDFLCDESPLMVHSFLSNPIPTSQFLWSTGSSDSVISVSKIGKYVVTANNECGIAKDSVVITEKFKTPKINFGNDTILCNGKSIFLSATNEKVEYQWWNGSTDESVTVFAPNTVWAKATNKCGIAIDTIHLKHLVSPKNQLPKDTFMCGDEFYLDAGNVGIEATYKWDGKGQKTQRIKIDSANTYSVFVQNFCGTGYYSTNVTERSYPTPPFSGDTVFKNITSTVLNAQNPGAKYLWSTGQTTRTITVTKKGIYWVDITNGCGPIRDSIAIDFVGFDDLKLSNIQVYPNPSNGVFYVESVFGIEKINIYDLFGRKLDFEKKAIGNRTTIELVDNVNFVIVELWQADSAVRIPIIIQ
ncbi:MAG: hypothetical protein H6607_07920 [Flavobacteriales bacterium]|nr:hypothetical protein [Flavobacteriales bacterium]